MKATLQWLLVVAIGIGIFAIILYAWSDWGRFPLKQYPGALDKAGQFGDSFGYVNSLFSALALAALIVTVLLQSRELRLQREELRLQRQEMDESQEIWQETQKAQKKQADFLLVAAYLNGLISAKDSPPPSTLTIEQEQLLEALSGIVLALEPKVSKIVGAKIDAPSRNLLLARRVSKMNREFRREWDERMQPGESTLPRDCGHGILEKLSESLGIIFPAIATLDDAMTIRSTLGDMLEWEPDRTNDDTLEDDFLKRYHDGKRLQSQFASLARTLSKCDAAETA